MAKNGDVVLITGGSGFLGQHIVKHLQEKDDDVKEIRIIDLRPYRNNLKHSETKPIKSIVADICDTEAVEEAFKNVDVVFHCAAFINFQFPPNINELERINVNGTKNIINLCIKHNVPRLIYTSSASVTLTSYLGLAPFAVVVNQTESKTKTITKDQELLIPGYSVSKYRAEKIVLYANGTNLANDTGELITTAIRPTVFYGEEDPYFFPTLAKVTKKTGGIIPKLLGAGGKHQMTYVGNVAWAHIRAKQTLKNSPKNIAGLPVFVTDDTPIEDTSRFCQRLSRRTNAFNIRPTSWSLPSLIGYWLCIFLEMIISLLNPIFGTKLSFQPRALSAYAGSLLQYSRLRAELHMDYEPLYNEERSLDDSAKWYESWYKSHFNKDKISKKAT